MQLDNTLYFSQWYKRYPWAISSRWRGQPFARASIGQSASCTTRLKSQGTLMTSDGSCTKQIAQLMPWQMADLSIEMRSPKGSVYTIVRNKACYLIAFSDFRTRHLPEQVADEHFY